jgi:predicted alpha/beta superfamily hydrolase
MLLYSISNAIVQVKNEDIPFEKTIAIFSKILDEERPIYIYLPFGYDSNLKRYPVLYLTDGSLGAFRYYAGVIQYYNRTYFPKFIVVGIPNTDRGRDLSPNKWEQIPQSGGGENFLDFITDELIPLIDGSFRTTDYRLIAGFSAGGHFVLYTLFEKPEYFNAFIAASASNNDHEYMMKKAREFIVKNTTAEKYLFLPYFEGDFTICTESVPEIVKLLEKNKPEGFQYKVKIYKGMGHVPPQSLLDGLITIFEDWQPVEPPVIIPAGGEFLSGGSIEVEISSDEDEIRYTLDGSEPTRASPLYTEPLVIRKSTKVKAKSFRKNLAESSTAAGHFESAGLRRSLKDLSGLKSGLRYKYFEQQWFNLPNEIDAVPVKTGIASMIDVSRRKRNQGFLFQFDGYIHIPKSGAYCFYLRANARRKLFIGDKMLMVLSSAGNVTETDSQIILEAGYHPIRVLYTNCWMQGQYLELWYKGEDIEKQIVSEKMLFYD